MPQDFAAIIRAAINASGKSQSELSRESGVSQPKISQFLSGRSGNLREANALAVVLGLELVPSRDRKPRKQQGGATR